MNNIKLFSVFVLLLLVISGKSFAQVYSLNDIVNIYDPFMITFNEFTLNTTDDDFRENPYVFIITISYGNEKVVKFLKPDDVLINSVKEKDNYSTYNFSVNKNNVVLLPAFYNIRNDNGNLNIKFDAYSNIAEIDQIALNNLSTGFVYTSDNMNRNIELAYKYLATGTDPNRPNNALLTTAEVLQQNVKTRPEVFALGTTIDANYIIPQDPQKILGPNVLYQGKKTAEAKFGTRTPDAAVFTISKLNDVKVVKAQPYFIKVGGVFQDLTSQTIVPIDRREGLITKAAELINNDLTIGLKHDTYLNDQAAKQYTHLLNLIIAGVRAKADTASSTNEIMNAAEREALSYIENNLRQNEFNLNNQYIYDDYINSSVNRGILQKEIDRIKRYYQIK